ncbi:MAG: hypothetical protein ACRD2T_07960, partial [Thermoanaerobaculia bacterium]
LWPLGHYSQGPGCFALRALPFFDRARGQDGESLGVGTVLFRRHQDLARKTVAHWAPLPLVHWKRSPEGLVAWAVPAFYRREEKVGQTRKLTTAVAPGIIHHVSTSILADGSEGSTKTTLHAPWPLLRWFSQEGSRGLRLLPSLDVGTSLQRSWGYLYPLVAVEEGAKAQAGFWHFTSAVKWYGGAAESYFRLAPFLFDWRRGPEGLSVTGPLAWFRHRSTAESGWFHLFPLAFGERQGDRSALGVFPVYYRRGWGGEAIRPWTAGRFFFLWNRLAGAGVEHRSLLWKAMEFTREPDGDFEFRLFHRLVVNRSVGGQREIAVSPFFRTVRDDRTGSRRLSILKFLYTSELKDGVETRRILFIPISRKARDSA